MATTAGKPRRGVLALCREVAPMRTRSVARAVLSGALASTSAVALLATSAWLITRASLRPPVLTLAVAIACVQACALLRGIARYVERLAVHDVSLSMLARLRLFLFDLLEPLVPGGLPGRRSGALLSAFVADADAVGDTMTRSLLAAIDIATSVAVGVGAVALVDPRAGIVLAGGACGTGISCVLAGWAGRDCARREAAARAELYDVVIVAVRAAPELVAFGREDLMLDAVAPVEARSLSAGARRAFVLGLGRAVVACLSAATVLGVIVEGLARHGAGHLSGVTLAVIAFIALAVLEACSALPEAVAGDADGAAAAGRIEELGRCVPPAPEPRHPATAPARGASIALEAAAVSSADGTPILDGVSFEVAPGRRVALVGASGAGKTTAIYALLHFLECSTGRAVVGGVDVSTLARVDLKQRLGWVPDDPHIFGGTLGANLRLADPSASVERCLDALDRVGLGDWLNGLPDGLGTRMGPGGQAVSAGQRQRISLARALLSSPDVLLLDEPTAHLDPAGAASAIAEILEAAGPRAILLVSHDAYSLRHVDNVVTIADGRTTTASGAAQ